VRWAAEGYHSHYQAKMI